MLGIERVQVESFAAVSSYVKLKRWGLWLLGDLRLCRGGRLLHAFLRGRVRALLVRGLSSGQFGHVVGESSGSL